MKVGVYVGATVPSSGGGHTFTQEIVRELSRRDRSSPHRFTLLSREPLPADAGLDTLVLRMSPQDVRARVRRRALRVLRRATGRVGAAAGSQVDPFDLRTRFDVLWHLVPFEVLDADVPYITVVWDLQHRLQPYFPEVSAFGEAERREEAARRVLARAALVITGTQTGQTEIARFFGVADARIRVLPHPTPADALDAASRAVGPRPPWLPAAPYVCYPAQFWAHKNHVTLVDALAALRRGHDGSLRLVLTGSDKGNLAHVLAHARKAGVSDAVDCLGLVERERVLELYRHAEALTYVTHFGPENLPPLEAFALGCPVVASDVAGAREQLADAALLIDPRSADAIAEAVIRVRSDAALRNALVQRGLERARRFTVTDFVDDVCRWLDEFERTRRCWPMAPD